MWGVESGKEGEGAAAAEGPLSRTDESGKGAVRGETRKHRGKRTKTKENQVAEREAAPLQNQAEEGERRSVGSGEGGLTKEEEKE